MGQILAGVVETIIKAGKHILTSRAVRHVVLGGVWAVLISLGAAHGLHWSYEKAYELFENMPHGEILKPDLKPTPDLKSLEFADGLKLSDKEKSHLKAQSDAAGGRARFHLKSMVFVFSHYYMGTIVSTILGAIAAVLLVFISKPGWSAANEYLLSLFVITTSAALVYKAFPGLFEQERSIDENKQLYMKYVALEREIRTYAATGVHSHVVLVKEDKSEVGSILISLLKQQKVSMVGPTDAQSFILYVDKELAGGDLPLGIDHSKSPDFGEVTKSLSQGGAPH